MSLNQDTRFGRLTTDLGKDVLVLLRFDGREHMNGLFDFRIEALSTRHEIDFDALIGTHATLEVKNSGGMVPFDGIVTEARWLGPMENGWRYTLTLRPWIWLASKRRNQRIFHDMTATDIIREVLSEYSSLGDPAFKISVLNDSPTLEYTVQYRESDLDFVRRMMERFGFSFFFEHKPKSHTLVITDNIAQLGNIGSRPYYSITENHLVEEEHFWELRPERRFTTGAIRLTDYNFKTPTAGMEVEASGDAAYAEGKIESFDYPGDYLEQTVGFGVSQTRALEERGGDHRMLAAGDTVDLKPGCVVKLGEGDFAPGKGLEYVCLSASYRFVGQGYGSGSVAGDGKAFEADYRLIPTSKPLVPPRQTPVPIVRGPQTATVVGDGEIDCDEFGRILVRFHWDLHESISMRCRVQQTWAGGGWGAVVIPRIGMEVLVEFLEGDPDKPMVVGSVYNGQNDTPYPLDQHKSKAVFRSDTHQGSGFNELVFEDQAGQEHIAFKAQKDLSHLVLNDSISRVKNSDVSSVGNNQMIEVGNNQKTEVGGSMTMMVGGTGAGAESVMGSLGKLAGGTASLISKGASEGKGDAGSFGGVVGGMSLGFLSGSGLEGRDGLHQADETGSDANDAMRQAGSALGASGGGLFETPGTMNTIVSNYRSDTTGVVSAEQVGLTKILNIGGALMETIGISRIIAIGEKMITNVGKSITTKTKKHTLVATEKFKIQGPGGSIEINQSGMIINATQLKVKSPSVDFVPGASVQMETLKGPEPFCEKCRGSAN